MPCVSSEQACDQWHSSRVFTFLTSSHCNLRPNTKGLSDGRRSSVDGGTDGGGSGRPLSSARRASIAEQIQSHPKGWIPPHTMQSKLDGDVGSLPSKLPGMFRSEQREIVVSASGYIHSVCVLCHAGSSSPGEFDGVLTVGGESVNPHEIFNRFDWLKVRCSSIHSSQPSLATNPHEIFNRIQWLKLRCAFSDRNVLLSVPLDHTPTCLNVSTPTCLNVSTPT
jgi:hypothetical protein